MTANDKEYMQPTGEESQMVEPFGISKQFERRTIAWGLRPRQQVESQ